MLHKRSGAERLGEVDSGAKPGDRARAFASSLTGLGIACRVEVDGLVAFLSPALGAEARCADPELRRAILAMGRSHGFPRVALIIGDD